MTLRPAVLSLAAAALMATLHPAFATAGAWMPAPGDHYSELRGSLFSADSYYDQFGFRHPLVGGGLHEDRALTSYNEFGWKKHVSFIFAIPAASVTRRTGNNAFNHTETGIGDLTFGLRAQVHGGPTAVAFELDWNPPGGYKRSLAPRDKKGRSLAVTGDTALAGIPDVAELAPTLGAGQQDLTGTLNLGTHIPHGFLELAGGYRYRDPNERLASQFLMNADIGFWLGPSLLAGGRYQGAIASGDGRTASDKVTEHLAGPLLVYRVDNHLDLIAGSLHSASAKNALHMDQFYVGLTVKQTRLNRLQGFLGGKQAP
jgi:hypothetical protein